MQIWRPCVVVAVAIAAGLSVAPRTAETALILLEDHRFIDAEFGPPFLPVRVRPAILFEPIDVALNQGGAAGARQQTSISTDGMSGWGDVFVVDDGGPFIGRSLFRVHFRVDEPTPYVLSGNVDSSFSGSASALLMHEFFIGDLLGGTGSSGDFHSSGVLPEGIYILQLYAMAAGDGSSGLDGDASWSFNFAVPEPAPLLLLALAAGFLGCVSWRRARAGFPSMNH